jgi:hypothetical protein
VNAIDTRDHGFIGWAKPVAGYAPVWRPIVAAMDPDECLDLLRDYAPRGVHLAVTPAHVDPPRWLHDGRSEHWD